MNLAGTAATGHLYRVDGALGVERGESRGDVSGQISSPVSGRRKSAARADEASTPHVNVSDGDLQRYAQLALHAVGFQAGQPLLITALSVEHAPLVRALAEEAYANKAASVDFVYQDSYVRHSQLRHASGSALTWESPAIKALIDSLTERKGAWIQILGTPDFGIFDDVDIGRVIQPGPPLLSPVDGYAFTSIAYPTAGWARAMFGEPDVDRLWKAIAHIAWLDEPDPIAACQRHIEGQTRRARRLNEHRFDAVRFVGSGTDIKVGLLPEPVWGPVIWETSWGRTSLHSLPWEEIIATPDFRRTEGVVRATRPMQVPYPTGAAIVRDLELRFEAGRVVEAKASTGLEWLLADLDRDAQARYLGEVALVDGATRAAQTGLTFFDTLYDESATSQLAYGMNVNLPGRRERFQALSVEEQLTRGLNVSSSHTDFMIGGPGVDAYGITKTGEEIPLIVNDRWAISNT
jgi:aminopeptidase